jgi:hypothetical protein
MPLNKDLSVSPPLVSNNELKNNIIDFGENIYYISRFQGYIYANAEIIKYDAVQYAISGTGIVWISSNLEYQDYFSKLPFNGKIYPTGLVRIYAKPYYETVDSVLKMKNGEVVDHGRGQFGTPITEHLAGISSYWTSSEYSQGCTMDSSLLYSSTTPILPSVVNEAAGVSTTKSYESQRNGIIKNFLSSPYQSENSVSLLKTTSTGTVQSSALVFRGPSFTTNESARNFISYSWKKLDEAYKHVGTRLRITGKVEAAGDRTQTPSGGMPYYTLPGTDPTQPVTIGGGSGGIAIVNPATNVGYYFEIAALTSTDLEQYASEDNNVSLHNVLFYKVQKHASNSTAIPTKLWGGNANILVDDGNFTGQYRFVGEENPTVYDLSIEYVNINASTRVFYLYLNQKLINIVTDRDAIPMVNSSIGLFVRGTSRLMFENVYALSKNYSENSVFDVNSPISNVFDDDSKLNATEALSKYALSGMIQKTYLSGINPAGSKAYNMYYEEFGTIMREAAYFNIKYDKAYPALSASIAPTFNRIRGYSVSGFMATSYGAEFLIFNNTDTILNLDETTGNYLRILGIAFTQDTTQVLTVDDYFKKRGNLSNVNLAGQVDVKSPYTVLQDYNTINNSRIKYGKNEFSLESPYIQDSDTAEDILGWIIDKSLYPRKSVGVNIFPIPTMQLGDIVTIDYKTNSQLDVISSEDTRFVVYNIEYSKNINGPSMTIYLSEV